MCAAADADRAGRTGKTRLSLRLAEEVAGDFPGGVLFVALTPIDDPGLLLAAIASALGVPDTGEYPLIEHLVAVLGRSPHLLLAMSPRLD